MTSFRIFSCDETYAIVFILSSSPHFYKWCARMTTKKTIKHGEPPTTPFSSSCDNFSLSLQPLCRFHVFVNSCKLVIVSVQSNFSIFSVRSVLLHRRLSSSRNVSESHYREVNTSKGQGGGGAKGKVNDLTIIFDIYSQSISLKEIYRSLATHCQFSHVGANLPDAIQIHPICPGKWKCGAIISLLWARAIHLIAILIKLQSP